MYIESIYAPMDTGCKKLFQRREANLLIKVSCLSYPISLKKAVYIEVGFLVIVVKSISDVYFYLITNP